MWTDFERIKRTKYTSCSQQSKSETKLFSWFWRYFYLARSQLDLLFVFPSCRRFCASSSLCDAVQVKSNWVRVWLWVYVWIRIQIRIRIRVEFRIRVRVRMGIRTPTLDFKLQIRTEPKNSNFNSEKHKLTMQEENSLLELESAIKERLFNSFDAALRP